MLIAYTDGGKRKDKGAWAFVFVDAPALSVQTDYQGQASGDVIAYGYGKIQNLQSSAEAEVVAALNAVTRGVKEFYRTPLLIVSDSMYVINGLKQPHRMAMNNEKYRDLWMELVKITPFHEIGTKHVKGHTKQTFNGLVDWMCGDVLDNEGARIARSIALFNNQPAWRKSLIKSRR